VISHIQISAEETFNTLITLFESLEHATSNIKDNTIVTTTFTVGHKNFPLESLMGMTIKSITSVAVGSNRLPELVSYWDRFVNGVLVQHGNNEMIARGVFTFMEALQNK
jgi:hypothetical protein